MGATTLPASTSIDSNINSSNISPDYVAPKDVDFLANNFAEQINGYHHPANLNEISCLSIGARNNTAAEIMIMYTIKKFNVSPDNVKAAFMNVKPVEKTYSDAKHAFCEGTDSSFRGDATQPHNIDMLLKHSTNIKIKNGFDLIFIQYPKISYDLNKWTKIYKNKIYGGDIKCLK